MKFSCIWYNPNLAMTTGKPWETQLLLILEAQRHLRIRHLRGSTHGFEIRKSGRAWWCGNWSRPMIFHILGDWTSINPNYFGVSRRVSRCWPIADLECDWHRLWPWFAQEIETLKAVWLVIYIAVKSMEAPQNEPLPFKLMKSNLRLVSLSLPKLGTSRDLHVVQGLASHVEFYPTVA